MMKGKQWLDLLMATVFPMLELFGNKPISPLCTCQFTVVSYSFLLLDIS